MVLGNAAGIVFVGVSTAGTMSTEIRLHEVQAMEVHIQKAVDKHIIMAMIL